MKTRFDAIENLDGLVHKILLYYAPALCLVCDTMLALMHLMMSGGLLYGG